MISDCPRPIGNRDVCHALFSLGVESLLVVDDDLTPWPSRQGELWCYVRPFADPRCPTSSELQRITDYVRYENAHGRTVGIWAGFSSPVDSNLADVILDAATKAPPRPNERPLTNDACCCRPFHDGCHGNLLCHGAPVAVAQQILDSGRVLSRPALTGKPLAEIAHDKHASGQLDAADYFDYVCLANGDCVAPDIVAIQREAGVMLDAKQCDQRFYPTARFFFDPGELFSHPGATWDGIQALKVRDAIDLDSYLVTAVVPEVDRVGAKIGLRVPQNLEERITYLDHRQHDSLSVWSSAAFEVALQTKKP